MNEKSNKIVKKFNQFINEQKAELNISSIFNKHARRLGVEFNDDNWIERREDLLKGLNHSLELVGSGEIEVKSEYDYVGDRLMYKELFKDDTLILVIHAAFTKHPYGGGKLYRYEIGVYRNNPRTQQIGGGYGASGIMSIAHTNMVSSIDNYCSNQNVISATCIEIKKYSEENF